MTHSGKILQPAPISEKQVRMSPPVLPMSDMEEKQKHKRQEAREFLRNAEIAQGWKK